MENHFNLLNAYDINTAIDIGVNIHTSLSTKSMLYTLHNIYIVVTKIDISRPLFRVQRFANLVSAPRLVKT